MPACPYRTTSPPPPDASLPLLDLPPTSTAPALPLPSRKPASAAKLQAALDLLAPQPLPGVVPRPPPPHPVVRDPACDALASASHLSDLISSLDLLVPDRDPLPPATGPCPRRHHLVDQLSRPLMVGQNCYVDMVTEGGAGGGAHCFAVAVHEQNSAGAACAIDYMLQVGGGAGPV